MILRINDATYIIGPRLQNVLCIYGNENDYGFWGYLVLELTGQPQRPNFHQNVQNVLALHF